MWRYTFVKEHNGVAFIPLRLIHLGCCFFIISSTKPTGFAKFTSFRFLHYKCRYCAPKNISNTISSKDEKTFFKQREIIMFKRLECL